MYRDNITFKRQTKNYNKTPYRKTIFIVPLYINNLDVNLIFTTLSYRYCILYQNGKTFSEIGLTKIRNKNTTNGSRSTKRGYNTKRIIEGINNFLTVSLA